MAAIWSSLRFLMNFRIGFSIYKKKGCWDLDRDCTEYVDHFE